MTKIFNQKPKIDHISLEQRLVSTRSWARVVSNLGSLIYGASLIDFWFLCPGKLDESLSRKYLYSMMVKLLEVRPVSGSAQVWLPNQVRVSRSIQYDCCADQKDVAASLLEMW